MAERRQQSQVPAALGFALTFLTFGVGVVRDVEPLELIVRSTVVGTVSVICAKVMIGLWANPNPDQTEPDH